MSKLTLAADRSRRRGRMELLLADLAALGPDYQPGEGEGKLAKALGKALWRVFAPPAEAPAPESLQVTGNPGPPEELKKVKPAK